MVEIGWARFDDDYSDHRKVRALTPLAELLDMRAIIYCAKYDTDGVVSLEGLADIAHKIPKPHEKADQLVRVGRWSTAASGGWVVHDFLEYNPSRADREVAREANRERQARWRRNAVSNANVTMGTGNKERIDGCKLCDSSGWLVGPDRSTLIPTQPCDHPAPLELVPDQDTA